MDNLNNNDLNNSENMSKGSAPFDNNVLNPPGAYFVPYTAPLKKEYTPLSKKENSFIFIVLAGLVLFVDFSLFHGFSLGFTISYAVIFAISTAFLYEKGTKFKAFEIICGILSLALSVGNSLFNNSFIKPVSVLIIGFLFAIYCLGISGGLTKLSGSYKMLIDLFLKTVIAPFDKIGEVFGSIREGAKNNKKGLGALLGILLSIPVLLVVIPLLVSSDAAFEGLVEKVIENIGEYLIEIAIAIIILPFFYSYLFNRKRDSGNEKAKNQSTKKLSSTACTSFLSVISITYLVYLFSQLAYFFSAFKGILPEGYSNTASAFARRGFYEMFAISVINLAVISLVSVFAGRKNKKLPAVIKVLSTFISLFSVLLLVIAMQKMRLNIETYGLSVNRVLVCAFMLMMLVVIAFFILHIYAPRVKYMQPIIIICAVIFIALTFADVDRICADYNIEAYSLGKLEKLDIQAISLMSDSAVPSLVKLTESKDEKIAKEAKENVAKKIFYYSDLYLNDDEKSLRIGEDKKDFRAYNKAQTNSLKLLKEYFDSLPDNEKKNIVEKYW